MDYKNLLEQRAAVLNEINNFSAEVKRDNRSMTGEELEKFDKMDADFKSLSEKIETMKRVERSAQLMGQKDDNVERSGVNQYRPTKTVTSQEQELAFKCWALKQAGKDSAITRAHTEAAQKLGVNLNNDSHVIRLADRANDVSLVERNQSSSVNSEGGYLQNDGTFQSLERNMKWFGGARQIAKVIRTDTGEPLSWAYSDDTANVGYRQGQNAAVTQTNVTYQKKVIGEFTYVTSVYPVSVQLLQDARISVTEDIGEVLGQRLARLTNTDYTNGNGAGAPTGFMTEASAGTTAAGAAIAYTDLVKLLFSVDKAYRDDPSFAFTMADGTLSALWQLEDLNQRPLFWNQMSNLASGNPLQILNKPIVINNDMPAIATGKKPICAIVGNKFIIRDVQSVQIMALRELYMQQLAVGFIAYLRTDCKLLNTNCAKVMLMP